jgi:putative CocE/NonD family hydrolase
MSEDLPDLGPLVAAARAAGLPLPTDLNTPLVPTPGATRRSFHLTMRDGVRVAVDLHLPDVTDGRVPTCLRSTRYWRSTVDDLPKEHIGALEAARWTAHGFALVLVDVRGTGASFGSWPRGWDDTQRDDLCEILDWVVAQPWSDGTVGGYGTSYDGTTAHLLAATGHPAVRAVVPRFALFDAYAHISAPGGVPQDGFTQAWAAVNWTLDGHPDRATVPLPLPVTGQVRPVDGDDGAALLASAQAEHAANWDLASTASVAVCRDDAVGADGVANEQGTPRGRIAELRAAGVPTWLWSGWYDGAYAAAQLAQLADPELDVRVTIGAWAHGASAPMLTDPLAPTAAAPSMAEQVDQIASFLRSRCTTDSGAADLAPNRLSYYRMGDGWQESDSWPPATAQMRRTYLHTDGSLAETPAPGRRGYDVDFTASSGIGTTRWATLLGGTPVHYPDRREEDAKLLVWDGHPLAHATGLTGNAVLHLEATFTSEDAAVHAYLEAVRPDGYVHYLTEGQLRASHRKPGEGPAPYETYGPWHSHRRADLAPLVPGEPAVLELVLWPVSVLLPAGWRLRLALAGADTPTFRRVPDSGEVHIDVHGTSWLDLPLEGAH